jgi:3-deoxy-D-manno-octulosonate 8-phosphate phosphatase (KDO 8-P phosphatase)
MTTAAPPASRIAIPEASPASSLDAGTVARLRTIRWVGFDVDGVLTDAGVYVGDGPDGPIELKRFDIQDGLGVKMLQWAGLSVAFVSGRVSPASVRRARELGVPLHQDDGAQKVAAIGRLLDESGGGWDRAAFVGDDLPDLAVLRRVALPVVPANGTGDAKAAASLVLTRRGGGGAVREFCEWLLRARGEWDALVERYVADRTGGA